MCCWLLLIFHGKLLKIVYYFGKNHWNFFPKNLKMGKFAHFEKKWENFGEKFPSVSMHECYLAYTYFNHLCALGDVIIDHITSIPSGNTNRWSLCKENQNYFCFKLKSIMYIFGIWWKATLISFSCFFLLIARFSFKILLLRSLYSPTQSINIMTSSWCTCM